MSVRRVHDGNFVASTVQDAQNTRSDASPRTKRPHKPHVHDHRPSPQPARRRKLAAATSTDKAAVLTHAKPANRGAVDTYAWQNKDPQQDGVEGTRADRAYAELGVRTGVKPVIVAVIDSGVDIHHEDLQGRLWVNAGEIPGNGIDDDHNGYPDDIHGWNFLGTRDANDRAINIDRVPLEMTRELKRLKDLARIRELSTKEKKLLAQVRTAVEERRSGVLAAMGSYASLRDQVVEQLKLMDEAGSDTLPGQPEVTRKALLAAMDRYDRELAELASHLATYLNEDFDPRAQILGDDAYKYSDRYYGNNDVEGPNALHGTHVAGIIAAVRGNGLGIDGIATDVRIMAIRAVPDGDEYDKDVANAVRYAVDNGAAIINMSFGKPYSPGKKAVDAAFRYAESKGVLVVHAAGNEHSNNDVAPNYPARYTGNVRGRNFKNWIEVAASSAQLGEFLPASFSNFGAKSVDLSGPGVKIPSTVPERDGIDALSGTSMAAPTVSGVAALILSQFPNLTAEELRSLLLEAARRHPELMVRKPAGRGQPAEMVPFASLTITGGIIDAYEALKLAQARYARSTEAAA